MLQDGCLSCEPDVLIDVEDGRLLLLVEAKFRSGKSSFAVDAPEVPDAPAKDQLAREWQNLRRYAAGREAWLLYVTADVVMPRKEMDDAQRDLGNRPGRMAWLSFRTLPAALRHGDSQWIDGLVRVLEKLDLTSFEGMRAPSQCESAWRFVRPPTSFQWGSRRSGLEWDFVMPRWHWDVNAPTFNWRFIDG